MLSDETPVRDLIDLERKEISLRVRNDSEIHQLELTRTFARSSGSAFWPRPGFGPHADRFDLTRAHNNHLTFSSNTQVQRDTTRAPLISLSRQHPTGFTDSLVETRRHTRHVF